MALNQCGLSMGKMPAGGPVGWAMLVGVVPDGKNPPGNPAVSVGISVRHGAPSHGGSDGVPVGSGMVASIVEEDAVSIDETTGATDDIDVDVDVDEVVEVVVGVGVTVTYIVSVNDPRSMLTVAMNVVAFVVSAVIVSVLIALTV